MNAAGRSQLYMYAPYRALCATEPYQGAQLLYAPLSVRAVCRTTAELPRNDWRPTLDKGTFDVCCYCVLPVVTGLQ